jgi:Domain of unknown function (DUF4258)
VAEPIADYVLTDHALFEMKRRGLGEAAVRRILAAPDQRIEVREGRVVLQARLTEGEPPKPYLLRVFVDVDRSPAEVVTVYRTSKIVKYWRQA